MQQAEIIHFCMISYDNAFLYRLKNFIKNSTHSHEQIACQLITELEELVSEGALSLEELRTLSSKAMDILAYFHFDLESLQKEDPWYRASIIHQISCGMLQALRMMRPDLQDNCLLNETAYCLYRYYFPLEDNADVKRPRPVHCQSWK